MCYTRPDISAALSRDAQLPPDPYRQAESQNILGEKKDRQFRHIHTPPHRLVENANGSYSLQTMPSGCCKANFDWCVRAWASFPVFSTAVTAAWSSSESAAIT